MDLSDERIRGLEIKEQQEQRAREWARAEQSWKTRLQRSGNAALLPSSPPRPHPSGAGVTDEDMLSMALHLRDIAARLVIAAGTEKGRSPSPATVMRMLREYDEQTATSAST
ncbi:hypothetical protein [Streptomyces sp. NPDC002540]